MTPLWLWKLSGAAHRSSIPFVPRLCKALIFLIFKAILPCEAEIEGDIVLEHYGLGVVIHPNVTIGKNARLYHQITLAAESVVGSPHRIVIGDNVTIGAGAIVLARGNQSLYVGDGAFIGAGAVVTRDVAPGQTVVGSPARPIKSRM